MKGFVRKLLNGPRHLSFPHVARSNAVVNAGLMPATDDRVVAGSNPSVAASPRNLAWPWGVRLPNIVSRPTSIVLTTVYVDIISCWSLLYGVYDGGK